MIKVLVWCENIQNKTQEDVKAAYPEEMHNTIAEFLRADPNISVSTATLDSPDFGVTDEILANTDVVLWWGHVGHGQVPDEVVEKLYNAVVKKGMGIICLHSAHFSKIFKRLMGTSCGLAIPKPAFAQEKLWTLLPGHPIAAGIPNPVDIEMEEAYNEFFDIPQPDELVFNAAFANCGSFRAGAAYHRGRGKVFYFQPGHETYPIYRQKEIQDIIFNAVYWANNKTRGQ
ncbi:MAG: ThuA domain-containing protein [Oscillospiraceae bacterium]|nr:ThuA domain-containing protein [Oscillospiraceae bacterium]